MLYEFPLFLGQQYQILYTSLSDGNNHSSTFSKLVYQGFRNMSRCAGYDDCVIRSMFLPSEISITCFYKHIGISEHLKKSGCTFTQFGYDFDAKNRIAYFNENSCLVT